MSSSPHDIFADPPSISAAEDWETSNHSIQQINNFIQKAAVVATSAAEASQRNAEATQKGKASLEHTAEQIYQLRHTIGETTRTVKQLAESAQQLSKMVNAMGQIASRTHLMSLNATLGATRGDKPGGGVAEMNDLRTLATQTAKASQALKQVTTQIQSETSTVMAAVEEGLQQIIAGTQQMEKSQNDLVNALEASTQTHAMITTMAKTTADQAECSRVLAQALQNRDGSDSS